MINDVLSKLDATLFSVVPDDEQARELISEFIKKKGNKEKPASLFYGVFADFFNNNQEVETSDLVDLFLGFYGLDQASIGVAGRIITRFQALCSISKEAGFFKNPSKNQVNLVQIIDGWIIRITYAIYIKDLKETISVQIENDTNTRNVSVPQILKHEAINTWIREGALTIGTIKFKEQFLRKAGKIERKWKYSDIMETGFNKTVYENIIDILNADPELKIYKPDEVLQYSELHYINENASESYPTIEIKTDNHFKKKKIISHLSISIVESDIDQERWDRIKELAQALLPV